MKYTERIEKERSNGKLAFGLGVVTFLGGMTSGAIIMAMINGAAREI